MDSSMDAPLEATRMMAAIIERKLECATQAMPAVLEWMVLFQCLLNSKT
jgi:hypothetical protein